MSFPGYAIAADDTAVWVYNGESGNVIRVDPKTNRVVATIFVGLGCTPGVMCGNVVIDQGAVWVASGAASQVTRIDPQTNRVVDTISLGQNSGPTVAVTPGVVWVSSFTYNSLVRFDPRSKQVVTALSNQEGAGALSFGAGSLWMCDVHGAPNGLVRIDPTTNRVKAQIDVSHNEALDALTLVALDKVVWVEASNGSILELERIDPATNTVSASALVPGTAWSGFAADDQGVWGVDGYAGVIRFNPQNGQVEGILALTNAGGIAVGAGSVWVAKSDGTLLRITPAA
jgi:streptogramin lyase